MYTRVAGLFEGLFFAEQGVGDSGDFSGKDEFCLDFAQSLVELTLVVVVEGLVVSSRLCGAPEEPPDFSLAPLGEPWFTLEAA